MSWFIGHCEIRFKSWIWFHGYFQQSFVANSIFGSEHHLIYRPITKNLLGRDKSLSAMFKTCSSILQIVLRHDTLIEISYKVWSSVSLGYPRTMSRAKKHQTLKRSPVTLTKIRWEKAKWFKVGEIYKNGGDDDSSFL